MSIRKEDWRGGKLVIDLGYRTPDGKAARYRKDAQVQTMAAARAEERRLLGLIAQYGQPFEPCGDQNDPDRIEEDEGVAADGKTFAELVDEYRATYMITDLKITSRRSYESMLESTLLPRFGKRLVVDVDGAAAGELDLEMAKRGLARGTRNNAQTVLRSVLRFAVTRGYMEAQPGNLPRLRPVEPSLLEVPSDADVQRLLELATERHRRSFALMAFAGLRPNEVRALKRRDMRLRWENGEAVGGFLSVREGWSHGQTHTPKTGMREIPIAPALARLLGPIEEGRRDGHLAENERGKPWGQYGLDQAFERVRKRAGLEGWSVYCLRHYAITAWLRAGVPVHVAQRMAGHKHLTTTQRYVHHLKEDLEDAGRRLARLMG